MKQKMEKIIATKKGNKTIEGIFQI